jgi:hypothetical protein
MNDYDDAFTFWRLLAETSVPFGSGKALLNESAPIVLSNALWYPDAESIAELRAFYAEQGVTASCFLDTARDTDLFTTLALTNANFTRTACYALLPLPEMRTSPLVTEQVSWTQARALAQVIAQRDELDAYAVITGQTLALALQLEPNLNAFIAYDETPVGAMLTLETSARLLGMVLESLTPDASKSLRTRLTLEARTRDKPAFVFEQTEEGALELWG